MNSVEERAEQLIKESSARHGIDSEQCEQTGAQLSSTEQ